MEQELYVDFPKLVYREHILWNEGRSRTFYEFSPGAGMVNPRGSIFEEVCCPQGPWDGN